MIRFLMGVMVAVAPIIAHAGEVGCEKIQFSEKFRIDVSDRKLKTIYPSFFGFNLTWVPFQLDLLNSSGSVRTGVVDSLSVFNGAVYRFPGGGTSNRYDWRQAIGSVATRAPTRAVEWRGPIAAKFGLPEYLEFVKTVGGVPWLQLNLHGEIDREWPANEVEMLAAGFARWLKEHEQIRPLRWELGNEVDRDFAWSPLQYAARVDAVVRGLRSVDNAAEYVAMLADHDATRVFRSKQYNEQTIGALSKITREFVHHLYLDGPPGGPPITDRFAKVCESITAGRRINGAPVDIWVTEFGRWPGGKVDEPNWKLLWPKTRSLDAAITVADAMISGASLQGVRGMFVHNLGPTQDRPWSLFSIDQSGLAKPTAPLAALQVLREGLGTQVLSTAISSPNRSGYAGGYDIRAVAMGNSAKPHSVWSINRSAETQNGSLIIRQYANKLVKAKLITLTGGRNSGPYGGDGEVLEYQVSRSSADLVFDREGRSELVLPGKSVVTIVFGIQSE